MMVRFFDVAETIPRLTAGVRLATASALCLMFSAFLSATFAADLIGVRFGPAKDATRIVFDIKGGADFRVSGDESGAGRLYVDFTQMALGAGDTAYKPGQGHIARYGWAKRGGDGVRAVFEFKKTAKIKEVFLIEPGGGVKKHRLVVDLVTADKKAFMASLPAQYADMASVIEKATAQTLPIPKPTQTARATPEPTSAPQKALAPTQTAQIGAIPATPTRKDKTAPQTAAKPAIRRTIVIDAGHGGRDPGALGQGGTVEKHVTLAAAKELSKILKKRGDYEVVLVRSDDSSIRPGKRQALARKALAGQAARGLFISLHSDALENSAVRGASVYTLSDKGMKRSASIAKSEDYRAYDVDLEGYDPVLGDILLDKAQDDTTTSSSRFAEILVESLTGKTPMLNRSRRTANLRVLLAPDVPAVLLEMAFISNAKDEANLKSKVWRKRTMTAVADAIDAYFEGERPQRHAAAAGDVQR